MLPLKLRLRLLNKLAQATTGATESTTSPTSTTTAVVAAPSGFQASGAWGWLPNVYNAYSATTLDNLVSLMHTALHYASEGKHNFQTLKNNSFNVDSSGEKSVDSKNLINLAALIYHTYLNSGNQPPQEVTPEQIVQWNSQVNQSQSFLNLSQISPTGLLAQKMAGNPKDKIQNLLRELTGANPAQTQQRQ
jgi:hypothetical protein